MKTQVLVYSRFERLWHWAQAGLVLALIVTGFAMHYPEYGLLPWRETVHWHRMIGWALVVLTGFAIFWHFTTGAWRQYLPTSEGLGAMARFYLVGIFKGESHPVKKTVLSKLNPLQRLTYLGLKVLVFPVLMGSGVAYAYAEELADAAWFQAIGLGGVAGLHTFAAFVVVAFLVVHVYLTTTGHTVTSNLTAMITGREDLDA